MYWETFKIGIITIGIIIVIHLLLQIAIKREGFRNNITSRIQNQQLQHEDQFENNECQLNEEVSDEEDDDEEENVNNIEEQDKKYENIKNELKEWIHQETSQESDWTSLPQATALEDCNGNNCIPKPTGEISGEPPPQVTSIDSIFEKQSVKEDSVNKEVVDNLDKNIESKISNNKEIVNIAQTTPVESENVNLKISMVNDGSRGGGYKSKMNQSNLGSGLNAWDNMESSYASI
tara:strand:- start:177 stop:878 length:702 start_codon:yes stop_codon:yes gene_type:complete